MKTENRFYIGKSQSDYMTYGYYYNIADGEYAQGDNSFIMFQTRLNGAKRIRIETPFYNLNENRARVLFWDENDVYLGFRDKELSANGILESSVPYADAFYFGFYIAAKRDYSDSTSQKNIKVYFQILINPYYKQLKRKYAKESNQVFFRESLDGKISLFRTDYLLIKNASLEDTLYLYVYRNNSLLASASFNKSDCAFDHFKQSVELKLTYNDKYSKILDAYENTYDLIKLAPALTPLTLTKRCVVQIYIQGERTLSNYAGGTYWETDVNEQIDNEDLLLHKYYFSKGPKLIEVDLQGFNYDINAAYKGISNSNIWNATSKKEVYGQVYKMPCSIVFTKVANAQEVFNGNRSDVNLMSSGENNDNAATYTMTIFGSETVFYRYDTYRIEIYTARDGVGTKIYQSNMLYGKDTDFTLAVGEGLYPMTKIDQPASSKIPEPNTFNLGEYVVEYQVWGRLLCDIDQVPSHEAGHEGEYIDTYDLPHDDFATPRRNYRKCIGLRGFDSNNSVVTIWQNEQTVDTPTSYGINDFGEYFIPPYTLYGQYFYPLARSSWANVSMWVRLGIANMMQPFEEFCAETYKEYNIKDVYHIGDVIKALLAEIDPTILHDKTAEYSSFLYDHTGASASALGNCDIYITQKTNILKGEYDQAAQKAEIKFKQLMDMLRDCFRCFWYIDDQNRFRIEHISYFMKGLSYNQPIAQIDLTKKSDKFNKKAALYCQQEVEYDKSDLISRYEFKYMDDVTKAMGGDLFIDVNNVYIQKDKTEEINIDGFTADIDYMLFLPDNFSSDGFALIMANSNKKVPIVNQRIKDEKQYNHTFEVYAQNWYASFNELAWHYMEDISGNNISNNNISLYPGYVKRCMKHSIEFPSNQLHIDVYKLIITDIGYGYIEEVTSNIDTDTTEIELRYEPN